MKTSSILTFLVITLGLLLAAACSKTPQLPLLAKDATILAFGDSLTAGTGAGATESYPVVLARLTGIKVLNGGVPGEVTAGGLLRLPDLLDKERPSLLILCHGGNDLLSRSGHGQIADNLRAMIRMAAERRISVMLLAVPSPDLSLKPPAFYEELSKEFQIPIELEALPRILSKGSLKSDHIHPNAAGYSLLATALHKLLKKSGALPV